MDIDVGSTATVSLAYDRFEDDNGKLREDIRAGTSFALNQLWTAEIEALNTRREDPLGAPGATGERTDVAGRLIYSPDEDYAAWIFAQTTVDRSGGLQSNDRYGIGARGRISDSLTGEVELSDGDLGAAGYARLTYEPNAGSQYYLGYKLDPTRAGETAGFTGSDRGTFVVGNRNQITEAATFRHETEYDLAGDRPSQNSTIGLTYTPNDQWVFDGNLLFGRAEDPVNGTLDRQGLSFGIHYSQGDVAAAGVTVEYREEDGSLDRFDRTTYGLSAYMRQQTSPDWRILADLDVLVSEANTDFRDGRYVEARVGAAYRPVENDRLNALLSYTYLEDLPGPNQVNIEGDLNGPRQRSHIFSADMDYDLTRQWTVGAKYGYRSAEIETVRGSGNFTSNTAHLGIVRADYHVTSLWDITAEARVMHFEETGVTETGGLAAVYRHFGNNVKAGVGYQFNDISDDMRLIEGRSEGVFFNVVAKF